MRMTKVRDIIAGIGALILILLLAAGILHAMGKPIPFITQ